MTTTAVERAATTESRERGFGAAISRVRAAPVVRTAVRVQQRYGRDSAGFLSAGITYFAFLSIFPLMLLALSAVGFVLSTRPDLQAEWTARVAESFPGLSAATGDNFSSVVRNRTTTGIAGLLGLAWTGRGVAAAASHGLVRIHNLDDRMNPLLKQLWLLGSLFFIGIVAVVAAGAGAMTGGVRFTGNARWLYGAGALVTFALDVLVFAAAYRLLAFRRGPSRADVLPGAVLAAVGWTALKFAGGWYATRTVANAEAVYGTFAGTIGILVLLYLASRLFMYGAVLNAVLIEREVPAMPKSNGAPSKSSDGNGQKSTLEIVRSIAEDTSHLVRKEVELARMELLAAVSAKLKATGAMAAAGVLALTGFVFLGIAATAALALAVETWVAALIVAGGLFLLAGLLIGIGKARMSRSSLKPEETVRTVKEDVQWSKELLKR